MVGQKGHTEYPFFRKFIKKFTKMKRKISLLILFIFLLMLLSSCAKKPIYYRQIRFMLGTIVEVTSDSKEAGEIAFREISRIENILSRYKEYSDIGQLNKLGKIKARPETLFVLEKAKEFWQLTDGAFDVSVGPLLDIWGFSQHNYRLAPDNEIKKTLRLVGQDKILIDKKQGLVRFKIKGMKIDLGGLAKGYAVDRAVLKLKEAGIKNALINAGGDIYCLGDKNGQLWKVAVKDPRKEGFLTYYSLADKAIATSGDYEQFFEVDNKRYSHIFDPKTGYPASYGIISVTVISDDCLTADALATSTFVLGEEKAKELAKKLNSQIVNIVKEK